MLTKSDEFRRRLTVEKLDSEAEVVIPLLSRANIDWNKIGNVAAEGNRIKIPDFVALVLGELAVEPQRCHLRMVRTELDGFVSGRVDLGVLTIDNASDVAPLAARMPEQERVTAQSTNLDEEQEKEILAEPNEWVNTHPKRDEPFLFFMGRTLTPVEFFNEVETKTEFGVSFVRFVAEQSKRFEERPTHYGDLCSD